MVAYVIDGDTVELADGSRVRYIGVDTPETVHPSKPVQCFGREASEFNRVLVEGRPVRLERDISDADAYGRLLRYAYLEDGTFVNLELVRQGYAASVTYPPDVAHAAEFQAAQREAQAAGRGLWGACQ
jgi:micrococcal nuclease